MNHAFWQRYHPVSAAIRGLASKGLVAIKMLDARTQAGIQIVATGKWLRRQVERDWDEVPPVHPMVRA